MVSIQLHINNGCHSPLSKTVTQDNNFFLDDPLLREVLDPPRHSRPRKAQLLSELIRRPAAILLKKSQQGIVDPIHSQGMRMAVTRCN